MLKRTAVCALCALVLISALAGCGETPAPGTSGSPAPEASPGASAEPMLEYDWEGAWQAYPLDAVVMTVNGEDVTWAEFFHWYRTLYIQRANGSALDTELDDSDGMLLSEFLKLNTEGYCIQYHVVNQHVKETGTELTETDQLLLDWQLESDIAEYAGEGGTEEDFYEYLETQFITPELYDFISRNTVLYPRMFFTIYGSDAAGFSDEESLAFAEKYGFMSAKHILFMTVDGEGNPLPEAEIAAKREAAEETLAELQAVPEAEREALFDELMNTRSEDTGLESFPQGYCFEPGKMFPEFEEGTAALEPGEISGIVETSYGYHIIMRKPVTPDDSVDLGSGQIVTLRYVAAAYDYDETLNEWVTGAQLEYSEEFKDFDMADILKPL